MSSLAWAGPRASANYSISTDTMDAGGNRSAGGVYSNDGTIGSVAGISTIAAPAGTAKHGYVGQLHDVTSLQISASGATLGEGTSLQLSATEIFDDLTTSLVNASSVSWGVVGGPIASVSSGGLATAGIVYQNSAATVSGTFNGRMGTMGLTVINLNSDDFGPYVADGLPDDWQVQYFGPTNASGKGGPNDDFSGTGQTNMFKYIAGLDPLNPNSRFSLKVQPVAGQAGQKNLVFNPIVSGRTYEVKSSTTLTTPNWQPLTSSSTGPDAGDVRTVTDLSATGAKRYYKVEITKP
jgi:hypothetical protein